MNYKYKNCSRIKVKLSIIILTINSLLQHEQEFLNPTYYIMVVVDVSIMK